MANNIFNATEGSGKAMSTETVTTLNGEAVSSRDIQRAAMAMVQSSGVAKDVLPGRQAAADGLAAALSNEDAALLAALLTAGTPITGQSLEAGGAGALGWFASIRKKIAAFGTAGTPSADVITVQGIGGGTALPVTSNYFELSLTGNAPTPSGTDLLNYTNGTPNGPVTASQMDIRDTAWNRIYIPLAIAGWRSIVIGIATGAPFDQALTFGFQATISTAGQQYNTAQNSITLAASTTANFILTSEPGGAAPSGAAVGSAYSASFLAGAPAVVLQIRASVAPAVGTIKLVIARRST